MFLLILLISDLEFTTIDFLTKKSDNIPKNTNIAIPIIQANLT